MSPRDTIERLESKVRGASGRLVLHAQNPSDYHHWTKHVIEADQSDWLLLIELAKAAVSISEAIDSRNAK